MINSKTLVNYKSTFSIVMFFIAVGILYGNKKYTKIQKSQKVQCTTDHLQTLNYSRVATSTFVRNQNNSFNSARSFYRKINEPEVFVNFKNSINEFSSRKPVIFQNIIDSLTAYPTFVFIEKIHPSFDDIVSPLAKIEILGEGFDWSEGPVWVPELKSLLFSDVPKKTRSIPCLP